MELAHILHAAKRWWWVMLLILGSTGLVVGYKLKETPSSYDGMVKLQITAPLPEDVELYSTYRSTNLRDDMTVARNNFIELLQSREVYIRTIKQLDLKGADAEFDVGTTVNADSDFLYVTIRARSPKLAEDIANTMVDMAIGYYGEVRSKPMTAAGNSLRTQLGNSEKQLRSAEQALADFEREHNIGALDGEINIANTVLQQLLTQRNTVLQTGKSTESVDTLIAAQRDYIRTLQDLLPDYSVLQENVQQARSSYQLLLSKYQEAALKEDSVRAASFIQVVEPAIAPARPAPLKLQAILVLWLVAALALSIAVALLLEFLSTRRAASSAERAAKRAAVIAAEREVGGERARVVHSNVVHSNMEEKATGAPAASQWFT